MSLLATLDALEEAGASSDVILAVVRAHLKAEDEAKTARREKDAARQRAKRSRDVTRTHADSRGHVDGHADAAAKDARERERARVRDNSPKLDTTGFAAAVVERASASSDDWPEGNAQRHAELLVELAASPWLDRSKSPDLVTTAGQIASWRRDGASWEHDVVPVVCGLVAKRRARIGSWKFFTSAVAQQIADNRAALEIPEAIPRQTGPPSLAERIAADNRESERLAFEMLDRQNGRTN